LGEWRKVLPKLLRQIREDTPLWTYYCNLLSQNDYVSSGYGVKFS
jgi:hypothetical protein